MAMLLVLAGLSSTAFAQRTVTLTLNTATIPDTTKITDLIEVRGAADGTAPATLADGNVIDWSDASTLEPENIGGDYWQISFDIAEATDLTFKFFSHQTDASDTMEGWEIDPNPNIPPGTGDTTLTVHFFELNGEYRGVTSDKGPYDWRPYEEKEDTIAVWFRVYMNTEAGLNEPVYDTDSETQIVGVRGDNQGGDGPLDWGTTFALSRETNAPNTPGIDMYSGVAYFPATLAGTAQPYKFVFEDDGVVGWEGDVNPDDSEENRSFVIPSSDTTLYWQYFSNTPALQVEPVTSNIIFAVDLSPLEAVGVYNATRGDSLQVRGGFNGWGCSNPTICRMLDVPGEDVFEALVPFTQLPGFENGYKFFLNYDVEAFRSEFETFPPGNGYEEPISTTGANRFFTFEGVADEQDLGVQFYSDVLPANIIPEGVSVDVTFQVTMDEALMDPATPFNPDMDSVTVEFGDPIWAWTQRLPGIQEFTDLQQDSILTYPPDPSVVLLEDGDQDGVYTGIMTVTGPTYSGIQYKYAYGQNGTFSTEAGGSTNERGRRRTRFVVPNEDGSWPTEWVIEEEEYQPMGLLPFDENPAVLVSVEPIGNEVPTKIALQANYPNPFNPETTIEYSINAIEHVSLKVYDITGRLVTTLVDGIQPPASYRVNFDAANLASGMYLYRLEAAGTTLTRKMVLLK